MAFNCTYCFDDGYDGSSYLTYKLPDLRLSGLSSLSRIREGKGKVRRIEVGAFHAVNNTFTNLSIDFESLSSLYVENNPNLETLLFNVTATDYPWNEIVIAGNPRLRLTSAAGIKGRSSGVLNPTFYWPSNDTSTMVFDGLFDNHFFQPFIDLKPDDVEGRRPHVLKKFVVKSSLGADQFNCSQLNELRKSGILKGEYSCQGQTVPDESGVGRVSMADFGVVLVVVLTIWGFIP
ncbi:hypothetical protein B0T16DRAFT_417359 [Cercophora newfieldiana]|uniref:Uncharacterized protein n=1 Tax=Cercophora newfieldiana TaxID=92897 RepID=A0AA39Y2H9_9PEZI|nr:hypothetical protein B0T16DRAFT_417359 [Cercophora newfieldiana]